MTMTPSKELTFASDDELLDDHHRTFSCVKLQMNESEDQDEDELIRIESSCEEAIDFDGAESVCGDENEAKVVVNGDGDRTGRAGFLSLNVNSHKTGDDGHRIKISITPMTPPSGSVSPDGHSTVSLNSSGGSPLFQNQKYRGQMSMSPNLYWRPQSPMPPKNDLEAKEFFAYRDSIVNNVVDEVQKLVEVEKDGECRGTWLLTEIDHWDNEKERIILLSEKSIISVKYDFIGMKIEDYRRISLSIIDKIVQGELKYPDHSLAPRLSGIAGGLVGVMKDCIIPKVQDTVQVVGNVVLPKKIENNDNSTVGSPDPGDIRSPKTSIMSALALENFEPRTRNVQGIRIMWNQDLPLSFTQKWNPFNKSIPWITFASHPLLWHKGGGGGINRSFDIESFSRELIDVLSHGGGDSSPMCRVEYKAIIIETYLGLASLFHNANSLGFYKVRGKVSF